MKSIQTSAATLCVVFASQGAAQKFTTPAQEVGALLSGNFSSELQSQANPDYFHIDMRSCAVSADWIPSEETWIYVEQGQAAEEFAPYRQRFYALKTLNDNTVESKIHEITNPENLVGWCSDPESITQDQVIPSTCSVQLARQKDQSWSGSNPLPCPTDFRGAVSVKTQVQLTTSQVISWDLGYDENQQVVWGPEDGGYVFDRTGVTKK